MKKILRYVVVGVVVLVVGGFVIADTVNQEVQGLADGDMELAGTANWLAYADAVVTKESGGVDDGSQVLRVAYGGTSNTFAYQIAGTAGKTYRATGWARGDGTAYPEFSDTGSTQWVGTTNTDWQYFDVTYTSIGTIPRLYTMTSGASYTEWDDIMITEYTPPIVNDEVGLLTDGDMENAGVASWTAVNNATLTKESGAADDGTQVLRIAHNGTTNPQASQAAATVGKTYRVTGWARSDGAALPYVVYANSNWVWTGTDSTDWQYFDEIFTAQYVSVLLQTYTSIAGYAEFDDVLITEYTPPMVNDNVQVLVDGDMENAGVGDWIAGASATITKQTGKVDDGVQVLRVAYGGEIWPRALQTILTAGETYRTTGWARGDGTAYPQVMDNTGVIFWTGTSANSWQYFDATATVNGTQLYLLTAINAAGYAEFDDVFITETEPQYNHYGQLLVDGDMEVAETLGAELVTDNDMEEDGTDIFFSNKFDLTQAANITADSGVVTGDVTPHSCAGAEFDGSNDYVTYTVPSTLFSEKSSLSIVVEFTPDFDWDADVNRAFYDSTGSARYYLFKMPNVNGNNLFINLGGVFFQISSANYSAYWNQNARNVLVISGTSGDTDAWLNGNQILTNDATAWTAVAPTTFKIGATIVNGSLFDGEIHAVSIYDGLLDGTDATNLYNSVDTDDWTASNSACLTKQLGVAESGSQVMRVAYGGSNQPIAYQTIVDIGKTYRLTGWARGDGTWAPRLDDSAVRLWDGTTSTDWQSFDIIYTATATNPLLRSNATSVGHVEYDDVSVKEVTNDGCDAWTAVSNAILSKESIDPQSGSLSMKIAYDDTNYPFARQTVMTVGQEYRVTGWAKGDGSYAPYVGDGTTALWTGTNSTSWQYFDETFTATETDLRLRSGATADGYVEFDGVVLTRTD